MSGDAKTLGLSQFFVAMATDALNAHLFKVACGWYTAAGTNHKSPTRLPAKNTTKAARAKLLLANKITPLHVHEKIIYFPTIYRLKTIIIVKLKK